MIRRFWNRWRAFERADFLSPKDLALKAFRLSLVFGVLHLAGLRENTTVISGTLPGESAFSGALGAAYIVAWLAFVTLAPALLIGAGIAWAVGRVLRRRAASPQGQR